MKKLLLIGAGGHCRSVIDVVRAVGEYEIVGLLGLPNEVGTIVDGIEVIGTDKDLMLHLNSVDECLITIGQIGSPKRRVVIWEQLIELNAPMATIVSPTAYVSSTVVLGKGSIVMHHALVNAGAHIGLNCIINTKALVEHDAQLGNHVHISTGAIVNGGTSVGDNSFIGSGAVLHHGLEFKEGTIITAGKVVSES